MESLAPTLRVTLATALVFICQSLASLTFTTGTAACLQLFV